MPLPQPYTFHSAGNFVVMIAMLLANITSKTLRIDYNA
jgi:hypothetical protein